MKLRAYGVSFILIFSAVVMIVNIAPRVSGATIYVDDSGGGDYLTIQDGINAAIDGDIVFVYTGTYYENVVVNKAITLEGQERDTTIIDAGGSGVVVLVSSHWANVTKFTVTGSGTGMFSDDSGIELFQVENCTVSDNVVTNNNDGIRLLESTRNNISGNIVSLNEDEGIDLELSMENDILDNTVSGNGRDGIYVLESNRNNVIGNTVSGSGDDGINPQESFDTLIIDNTAYDNSDDGIFVRASSGTQVVGNNASSNGGDGINLYFSDMNNNVTGNDALWNDQQGIFIDRSDDNYITNNNASWNGGGILLDRSDGNNILDNNVSSNGQQGIYVSRSDANNLRDNEVFWNDEHGFYISNSYGNNLTGNDMLKNSIFIFGWGFGYDQWINHEIDTTNTVNGKPVYQWKNLTAGTIPAGAGEVILINCSNINVNDQDLSDGSVGIEVAYSSNIIMNNNNVSGGIYGIYDYVTNGNTITGNDANFCRERGIYVGYSDGCTISGNNASYNEQFGIYLRGSSGCDVIGNNASQNQDDGIYIRESDDNNIIDNTVISNQDDGIYVRESDANDIFDNTVISNQDDGIYVRECNRNNITGNTVDMNQDNGIFIWRGFWNNITNNNASSNTDSGIFLDSTSLSNIIDNNASYNDCGIYLAQTSDITMTGNTMIRDGIFIDQGDLNHWNTHTIDTSNTVNGKPVYYWKDLIGGSIPSDAGEVILANCTGVDVTSSEPTNGTVGILMGFSTSCNILANNASSNNWYGIYLYRSNGNSILGNTASYNGRAGIHIGYSTGNSVMSNAMALNGIWLEGDLIGHWNTHTIETSNTVNSKPVYYWKDQTSGTIPMDAGEVILGNCTNIVVTNLALTFGTVGILMGFSGGCDITGNLASDNNYGVYLYASSNNNITNNTVSQNTEYGISLDSSMNNLVHHNNIMNNVIQAFDSSQFGNQWDNGYPAGGNYWSDYTGIDIFSGPLQDILGSDSIGDTPYDIDSDSRDNYPLMGPTDSIPPRIHLLSPLNNSFIMPSDILDFEIYDWDLDTANYSVDGGPDQPLSAPFDIQALGWADGVREIVVRAKDFNNNAIERTFYFTVDSIPPEIVLNTPGNNSVNPSGVTLDFSVTDLNLWGVNYSIDFGLVTPLMGPYDISTTGWADGDYIIQITAEDLAGNFNVSWYTFTIDSTKPEIMLNSPINNSIIVPGTILNLSIVDPNIMQVEYSVNGGGFTPLSDPFDISTAGWSEGDYTIVVNAVDLAGNTNSSMYFFTLDATLPEIFLNTPLNNSIIQDGTTLDFSITDTHLDQVTYSVNGGPETPLSDPFDISSGLNEGGNTIQITALDEAGNSNTSWYFFTIDSTKPDIIINNPDNNSYIPNGTVLDFSIIEPHLVAANYSVDGGVDMTFNAPYNISSMGWSEGDHTVQINCLDEAGNMNSVLFFFTIDSILPTITLNSPANNSYNIKGTPLDFLVEDLNLFQVNYSMNGGPQFPIADPFDISTTGLGDGTYTVQINAVDLAGNVKTSWFSFIFDSADPQIQLIFPGNNSVIQGGTILDFSITDDNLLVAEYSINGQPAVSFSGPYDIDTSGWADGPYTIDIYAEDRTGNQMSRSYSFTLDSTPPEISVDPALNHSTVPLVTTIQINLPSPDTHSVEFSKDGVTYVILDDPYDIDTSDWDDGHYNVTVKAEDEVGNQAEMWFKITVDAILPYVVSTDPLNQSVDVALNTTITITFNEPMVQSTVTDHVGLFPIVNFTHQWNNEGTVLTLSFTTTDLEQDTTYRLRIDPEITDLNGNAMGTEYVLAFNTLLIPIDTDGDGTPDSEDDDDDGDNYNDTVEISEGTDPLDPGSTPDDFDGDLIPDSTDPDDDNDNVLDEDDYDPKNPDVTEEPTVKEKEDEGFDMTILLIILIIVIVLVVLLLLMRRKKPEEEVAPPEEEKKELPPPPGGEVAMEEEEEGESEEFEEFEESEEPEGLEESEEPTELEDMQEPKEPGEPEDSESPDLSEEPDEPSKELTEEPPNLDEMEGSETGEIESEEPPAPDDEGETPIEQEKGEPTEEIEEPKETD
jgi:parallel beta-helix repeat protein